MKKHFRVILTAVAALAVLAAAVLAAGEYSGPAGSETDPLVTMSYIESVFTDYVQRLFHNEMTAQTEALRDSLEERVAALEAVGEKVSGVGLVFREVRVSAGSDMICEAGTELLLRSGSARALAGAGLADTSGGTDPGSGGTIQKNHMYLVTSDGCGFHADGEVTVLIRGIFEVK